MELKIRLLEHFDRDYPLPSYETSHAAGADVRCMLPHQGQLTIAPGQRVLIPTGMCFEIPEGFEVQVRPRSGLSLKTNLLVVNSPGTIDADYRGEIKIIMGNFGNEPIDIQHGDRIAQLVLAPVVQAKFVEVDQLGNTKRSTGGFGSTGVN
jgi:dUTP pyrophosphatase